jgi:hypothetical protein
MPYRIAIVGTENIFAATPRVLAAQNTALDAAQQWLQTRRAAAVSGNG